MTFCILMDFSLQLKVLFFVTVVVIITVVIYQLILFVTWSRHKSKAT